MGSSCLSHRRLQSPGSCKLDCSGAKMGEWVENGKPVSVCFPVKLRSSRSLRTAVDRGTYSFPFPSLTTSSTLYINHSSVLSGSLYATLRPFSNRFALPGPRPFLIVVAA